MTDFKPNLFGKICFVIFCIVEYLILVQLFKLIKTNIIWIDFPMWIGMLTVGGILSANLIWKLLKLYEK